MKQKFKLSRLSKILIAVLVVICVCPLLFMFSPFGQCIDIFGSQVPFKARREFVERTINAAIAGDDAWLEAAVAPEVLPEVRRLAPQLTPKYEILLSDSLGGLHEYKIQFESGLVVYLTFMGHWHTCPDFRTTEAEMLQNLELSSFEEMK